MYNFTLLAALAASFTLVNSHGLSFGKRAADLDIRVGLSNQAIELGSNAKFVETELPDTTTPPGSSGPFDVVELFLGAGVVDITLRCQLLDKDDHPIDLIRAGVEANTFAGGKAHEGGGPWNFLNGPAEVSSVTCGVPA